MQKNINLNNKQKHTDMMKMTNFDCKICSTLMYSR